MTDSISEQKNRAIAIAVKHKLSANATSRFVKFLIEWGKLEDCDWTEFPHYAGEWADRFKKKEEYSLSSGEATVALVKVDGMENAVKRLTKELDDYNGYSESHKDEARKRIERSFNQDLKGFKTVVHKRRTIPVKKTAHKNCICKSASRMIGKLPKIDSKKFLW